ncbi:hypothetical protein I0D68_10085 [Pseudomonas lalucatii]|nr:hypothetical protein I0D68_10085 [Pseudomonas lalucatii]
MSCITATAPAGGRPGRTGVGVGADQARGLALGEDADLALAHPLAAQGAQQGNLRLGQRGQAVGLEQVVVFTPLFGRQLADIGAVPAPRGFVEQGQVALGVAGHHALGEGLEQALVHFFLLLEQRLLALAGADVGEHAMPDHRAIGLAPRVA